MYCGMGKRQSEKGRVKILPRTGLTVGDACQNEGLGLRTDDVSKSQSWPVSQSPSKSIFRLWRQDGKTLVINSSLPLAALHTFILSTL